MFVVASIVSRPGFVMYFFVSFLQWKSLASSLFSCVLCISKMTPSFL